MTIFRSVIKVWCHQNLASLDLKFCTRSIFGYLNLYTFHIWLFEIFLGLKCYWGLKLQVTGDPLGLKGLKHLKSQKHKISVSATIITRLYCGKYVLFLIVCVFMFVKIWTHAFTRDLKVDGCQSNLYVMLEQLSFFINFTTFFSSGILCETTVLK